MTTAQKPADFEVVAYGFLGPWKERNKLDWRPRNKLWEPLVRLTDAQSALEAERQVHADEVERLRARLAFLTTPGALRFVEEDTGMYRVYEDKAPPERTTHFWRSITTLYYPSAAEAIDAARAAADQGEAS
jgi:hypothetical protein